jgi:serine/threonine protein kinase
MNCARCISLQSPLALDTVPEDLWDLLGGCLNPNPRLRITADRALEHPFITGRSKMIKRKLLAGSI